jgi:peptidoglycan/xylan/chitin deacetylase (PgdA/CDA1 family)
MTPHWAKRALRPLLARGIGAALRLTGRRLGLAVMYHRVSDPAGDPARELVPALGTELFDAQLRHLRARYTVVAASELVDAAARRRRGRRFPVAITFDDDLRSHVEVALPMLRRAGLPATFFLCGASLDGPNPFWWERLQRAADEGRDLSELVPVGAAASVHQAGRAIEDMAPGTRAAVSSRLAAMVTDEDAAETGLRRADVRALVEGGGDVGFHTRGHDALPGLDDDALATALTAGREELAALAGSDLRLIAYPHGRADGRVAAAARAAGFTTGFTGTAEAVAPGSDPLLLGRVEPSFDSAGRFAMQLVRCLMGRP